MKETERGIKLTAWILAGMLAVYVGAAAVINLFAPPGFYDADMYTDMRYAMEAWKHGSVFPRGWVFGNQLYVASTPVLAALMFGVTGDPRLSMGIASTVMTLLVVLSFHWMMKPVLTSCRARMAGSILFMGMMLLFGDAWHNTGGWQLLFTMCSYYACYAVTVFLAFGCYLRSDRIKTLWPVLIFAALLAFCTGIQSLRQTAVMSLPLLGVEVLRILICRIGRKPLEKGPLVSAAVISAANIAGLITARCLQLEQVEIFGEIGLTPISAYFPELRNGVLQAVSLIVNHDAVGYLMLGGLLLTGTAGAVLLLWSCLRSRSWKGAVLLVLLAFAVLAILAVDVMLTMQVRPIYYFMLFPLLGCLGGCMFEFGGKWGKLVLVGFLVILVCLSCVLNLMPAVSCVLHAEQDSAWQISAYLLENGYTTLYGAWNQGADVVIASDWKLSAGFWEDSQDPFFYYKYLCNPEIFRRDGETCAYIFYGEEEVQLAVTAAKTKNIEMTLLKYFPDCDAYLYTASENIMEAFW